MPGRISTILVCHPDPDVRGDLVRRLDMLGSAIRVVSAETPEAIAENSPDIVFFFPESMFDDADGVIRRSRNRTGQCRFIALISASESARIPQLFRAGVFAFVLPEAPADELKAAMHSVRQAGTYLARELADGLFSAGQNRQQFIASVGLTAREQEVLRLIAVNMSNKDIARRLDLSVRTVETHRLNIRKKANAGNWRELAVIAEKLGLLGEYDLFSGLAEHTAAPGFHEE